VNAENILPHELLVRQIQCLHHRSEMYALRADSRITPIGALPNVFLYKQSASNGRVGPAYETSISQGVF